MLARKSQSSEDKGAGSIQQRYLRAGIALPVFVSSLLCPEVAGKHSLWGQDGMGGQGPLSYARVQTTLKGFFKLVLSKENAFIPNSWLKMVGL